MTEELMEEGSKEGRGEWEGSVRFAIGIPR